MLDSVNVTCDGVPFTLDIALAHNMKIDSDSPLTLATKINHSIAEIPTEDKFLELEAESEEWEEKHYNEQERADILVDQLDQMTKAHDKLESDLVLAEHRIDELTTLELL